MAAGLVLLAEDLGLGRFLSLAASNKSLPAIKRKNITILIFHNVYSCFVCLTVSFTKFCLSKKRQDKSQNEDKMIFLSFQFAEWFYKIYISYSADPGKARD